MKRTIIMLAIGALVLVGGISSASAQPNYGGNSWYDSMHDWMAEHMGAYGYGPGSCWGGNGYYADDGVNNAATSQEMTVGTVDEAYAIAQDQISENVTKDNISQMGRWWVVYYTDDNGVIKQGRIDAYTGEVIKDFSTNSGNYYQSGEYGNSYRGRMGSGMMYGY